MRAHSRLTTNRYSTGQRLQGSSRTLLFYFGVNGRYCRECGFAWPGVNFLSTTGARTDRTTLWLDGFRSSLGEIRQAIFVDDPARGVASQLIGEDRSPAFAFVLYRSVEPKPRLKVAYRGGEGFLTRGGPTLGFDPEVAAGALVNQQIGEDKNDPAYWQDQPHGIIRLYFAWADEVARILASRPTQPQIGFLKTLKIGNPSSGGKTY